MSVIIIHSANSLFEAMANHTILYIQFQYYIIWPVMLWFLQFIQLLLVIFCSFYLILDTKIKQSQYVTYFSPNVQILFKNI